MKTAMFTPSALLVLADGTIFEGQSIGADGASVGELVFNTSMTGYQEMLSDPSYAEQIITLTAAHIGNTGCNAEDVESERVWAKGLVVRDCPSVYSNYRATESLSNWLVRNQVMGIAGLDTRALTHRLRDTGAMAACITTQIGQVDEAKALIQAFSGIQNLDLAQRVSRQKIESWPADIPSTQAALFHVVVYDFGVKHHILRLLAKRGCRITIVPARTSLEDVLALRPDGVVLSNGPGDPKACDDAINSTKQLFELGMPLFGICLGFQLLALACGATSSKMKFGHHGSNHPVIETDPPGRVYITSQNHGFTIDETSLPASLRITHRSLFDHSLQGIIHQTKPAFGFQGHPEASPGPHDIEVLFDQFIKFMMEYKCRE